MVCQLSTSTKLNTVQPLPMMNDDNTLWSTYSTSFRFSEAAGQFYWEAKFTTPHDVWVRSAQCVQHMLF